MPRKETNISKTSLFIKATAVKYRTVKREAPRLQFSSLLKLEFRNFRDLKKGFSMVHKFNVLLTLSRGIMQVVKITQNMPHLALKGLFHFNLTEGDSSALLGNLFSERHL